MSLQIVNHMVNENFAEEEAYLCQLLETRKVYKEPFEPLYYALLYMRETGAPIRHAFAELCDLFKLQHGRMLLDNLYEHIQIMVKIDEKKPVYEEEKKAEDSDEDDDEG